MRGSSSACLFPLITHHPSFIFLLPVPLPLCTTPNSQVFRVYPGKDYAELHYSVGPLPSKGHNHEVVTRFVSPINSSRNFYSDSNGRSYLKRVRVSCFQMIAHSP
ncbi:unnamed protein product [Closterium sp. NIES-54]